ncbi:sulfur carrier protein ThiS adenylyltransferase ThiF [Zongyangia hominis]|uniref:Sulfur carrier protein ThiS adenylyltransferase ThiF n=1 Tax=Zongyangia hominis TaxID=2763677 RepID=A0A926I781_9FIRM|nr:sulfur carrier protein ThiS adenylyltransferase ThiF [Zongyangia hominis]MBC8570809.1 sulfur carrier protein ThiS adenylyltransferase ThiF [Zongyangia hominis]
MNISLNGAPLTVPEGLTLFSLRERCRPAADVIIAGGFQTSADRPLREGDQVVFIRKGEMPSRQELESMMAARHTPFVHERVKKARVGVAGLGGLGSHIAVMLARTGVGHLILADFDVVEPSNLNRQHYFISHLGMPKTDALASQLHEINPFIEVETHNVRVTVENAASLFAGCKVVCEAFDQPQSKAELVSVLLQDLPGVQVVAASGMAGYESANGIITRRQFSRLYLCGDGASEAKEGQGLMAPRVSVCAGHQANMVLRLLLGLDEP